MKKITILVILMTTVFSFALHSQEQKVKLLYSSYGGGLPNSAIQIDEMAANTEITFSPQSNIGFTGSSKSNTVLIVGITVGVVVVVATTILLVSMAKSSDGCADSCSDDCSNFVCDNFCSQENVSNACNSSVDSCNTSSFGLIPVYIP